MSNRIPLTRPKFDKDDLIIIEEVLQSGWVAGQGPKNKRLASEFSKFVQADYAVPVNNCTAALHLSLLALNIGKGDDVLLSDFTFPATGHAVLYTQANPIFIDADIETYNLSIEDMKNKITKNTRVIIPVHAFGNPAPMNELIDFAQENNLKIIEDAACAIGAQYQNQSVGALGDLGCFSFHARKILATGEGGIVVGKDRETIEKVSLLSCFGMTSAKEREVSEKLIIPSFTELGYNYKLSDILAGLALSQLKKVTNSVNIRNNVVKIYKDLLENIEGIHFQRINKNNKHAYQSCVIRLESRKIRDYLFDELRKANVQTQFGTYSSVRQPIYNKSPELCPNSSRLFDQTLAIPLFDDITEKQITYVSEKIIHALHNL